MPGYLLTLCGWLVPPNSARQFSQTLPAVSTHHLQVLAWGDRHPFPLPAALGEFWGVEVRAGETRLAASSRSPLPAFTRVLLPFVLIYPSPFCCSEGCPLSMSRPPLLLVQISPQKRIWNSFTTQPGTVTGDWTQCRSSQDTWTQTSHSKKWVGKESILRFPRPRLRPPVHEVGATEAYLGPSLKITWSLL